MPRMKSPFPDEPSLVILVQKHMQSAGKTNIAELQIAFPERNEKSLYRTLRKLVERDELIQIKPNHQSASIWMTHEYKFLTSERAATIQKELNELFEVTRTPVTELLDRGNYDPSSLEGLLTATLARLVLSDNPYHREYAEKYSKPLLKHTKNLIRLIEVLNEALPVGFHLPPYLAERYSELQDKLTPTSGD